MSGRFLVAVSCLLSGCAAGQSLMADRYFEMGACHTAASAYRRYLHRNPAGDAVPRALFRLGLCQLRIEGEGPAEATFERLERRHPRSVYRHHVAVLLDARRSGREQERLLGRLRRRLLRLSGEAEELRRACEAQRVQVVGQDALLSRMSAERDELYQEIQRLQARITAQERIINDLRRKLAGLKSVDMQRGQGPTKRAR